MLKNQRIGQSAAKTLKKGKVQRLSRKGVEESSSKCLALEIGDDIV